MLSPSRAHRWPASVAAPPAPPAPPVRYAHQPAPAPAPPPQLQRAYLPPDRLSALPLELVNLIISSLAPPALLALSSTSRTWYTLLRHKGAAHLWRQARERAGLPPLALDPALQSAGGWGEVELARRLGGWACQLCGADAAEDADADIDARLSDAFFHLHGRTLDCVFRTSDKDMSEWHPQGFEFTYYTPDVLAVSAHLYYLEATALSAGRDPAKDVQSYVDRRQHLRAQVRADAARLKRWVKEEREREAWLEADRRATRHSAVFDKLEELGFDDIDYEKLFDRFEEEEWESTQASETRSECSERKERNAELEHFVESTDPLDDDEWYYIEDRVVAWVKEERRARLKAEKLYSQAEHRANLARLHGLIAKCVDAETRALLPPLHSFLRLPSLQALWNQVDVDIHGDDLAHVFARALADALEAVRADRLTLFDRLARTLLAEGDVLPPSVVAALATSPSPFLDANPSRGLAPAFAALSEQDLAAVFDRAAALFACGLCGALLPFASIVPHVHAAQGSRAPARCVLAPVRVRAMVRGAAGAGTVEECEAMGRVWEVTGATDDGKGWKLKGQTWSEVMQHNFVGVTGLKLGRTLRPPSAEGPGAAAAVAPTTSAAGEGKARVRVRVLTSFDVGDDEEGRKTYVCG
ncbi:hypothetical protein JCM10450v2_006024 [Rhodotorula kratochvilovae]